MEYPNVTVIGRSAATRASKPSSSTRSATTGFTASWEATSVKTRGWTRASTRSTKTRYLVTKYGEDKDIPSCSRGEQLGQRFELDDFQYKWIDELSYLFPRDLARISPSNATATASPNSTTAPSSTRRLPLRLRCCSPTWAPSALTRRCSCTSTRGNSATLRPRTFRWPWRNPPERTFRGSLKIGSKPRSATTSSWSASTPSRRVRPHSEASRCATWASSVPRPACRVWWAILWWR